MKNLILIATTLFLGTPTLANEGCAKKYELKAKFSLEQALRTSYKGFDLDPGQYSLNTTLHLIDDHTNPCRYETRSLTLTKKGELNLRQSRPQIARIYTKRGELERVNLSVRLQVDDLDIRFAIYSRNEGGQTFEGAVLEDVGDGLHKRRGSATVRLIEK